MVVKFNENITDLLHKRYFLKDENNNLIENTWENLCERIASNIASAENDKELQQKYKELFYRKILNLEFLPSSPCLFNAGTPLQQLSSCFIIDINDNMESIAESWKECSIIFKSGGGAGFNVSKIRPKGSLVSTSNGEASGVVSFMTIFNQIVEIIKQGGRRKGALKIDLNENHPEIYNFIHCKDNVDDFNNMNISVSISNNFMQSLLNDEEINLQFNNDVYRKIKAKSLWDEIIESTWKTGEPGLSFRDIMNADNMNPHLGDIVSSNPCLHKDTYMVTENGLERISKLKSNIWNGNEYTETKAWTTGIKPVIKLMTNSGFEYIVTSNHKFLMSNGKWEEAINTLGKKIKFEIKEKEWKGYNRYPKCDYRILGFELGDGNFHKASDRMKYIYITPEKDIEVQYIIEKEFNDTFYKSRDGSKNLINIPYGTIYANTFTGKIENRMIPDWILQLPKEEMKLFLQGLFSANGCNLKKYRKIQLVSINKEMLQQVQQMLLMFGIKSKLWYHNKKHEVEFRNGIYECKQSCHLVISRKSYVKFLNNIGFIQSYKNGYEGSNYKNEDLFETVILIQELEKAEVWDFTEPKLHQGITNGAIVHNCQEFTNIPYSSCNLGSINLEKIVINKRIDYKLLEENIRIAVRFLDDMISVNKLPLPKIDEVTKQIRPIGLGTIGYANMLYMLEMPYNSKDAYSLTDNLYKFIKDIAIDESINLAKEKGCYPAWKGSIWEKKNIKIRNSNHISIAPNGSIGFICESTGGIEPEYALVYTRTTGDKTKYYVINKIFKQKLIEMNMYNDDLLKKISDNNGSIKNIKEIPKEIRDIFVTTYDLTPKEHLKTLSIVQKYVDLAISKTINLSKTATKEEISDIYIEAWKNNIKGVTVYRDGSRQNQVLVSTSENTNIEFNNNTIPRGFVVDTPDDSKGKRRKIYTGCGTLYVKVFYDEFTGEILETFLSKGSTGGCERFMQFSSRLMSRLLRIGDTAEGIADQALSVGSCPSWMYAKGKGVNLSKGKNCPSAIAYTLLEIQKEIKEELGLEDLPKYNKEIKITYTERNNGNKCPECGETMRLSEGCSSCVCGYSKCN